MGCGASKDGQEASKGEAASPRPLGNLRTNAVLVAPPSECADALGQVGEFLTDVGTAISQAVDEFGQVGMCCV